MFITTILAFGIPFLVVSLIGLFIVVFEIVMFVHVLQNKHLQDKERILWVLGMLLFHPFVAVAYYFTARTEAG